MTGFLGGMADVWEDLRTLGLLQVFANLHQDSALACQLLSLPPDCALVPLKDSWWLNY